MTRFFIVTGAGTPPFIPKGENDGPIGAAAIARTVLLGLGAVPVYLCEQHHLDPIVASSEAAGVPVRPSGVEPRSARGAFAECAPTTDAEVAAWAAKMYAQYSPVAAHLHRAARPEPSRRHPRQHGHLRMSPMVDLSPILTEAPERKVVSIGIGDAGNEIGFGRIFDDVREIQEPGAVCRCPCDGMATVAATDVLVVASVSNWGYSHRRMPRASARARRPAAVTGKWLNESFGLF